MIPSVDYTKSFFLPVTSEVGVQTIIGISLNFINKDILQSIPVAEHWVLVVYDVKL